MYGAEKSSPELTRIEREMTTTVAEFERLLRLGAPFEIKSLATGRYLLQDEDLELEITLKPRDERRIGILSLPCVGVEYMFRGGTLEQRRRLLARLDLAMQRGGG